MNTTQVAIYARVSSDQQAEAQGTPYLMDDLKVRRDT